MQLARNAAPAQNAAPDQLPEGCNFNPAVLRQLLDGFDENSEKAAISWTINKVELKGKNMHSYASTLGVALIGRLQSIYTDQTFDPSLFSSSFNPKFEKYVCVVPSFLAEVIFWMGPLVLRTEDDNVIHLIDPGANELSQKKREGNSILFGFA